MKANAIRNAQLARIHIAKAQLGLDDDTYRAMLFSVARVTSAKDLDEAGRRNVLDHLKARGFKDQGGRDRGRPHNANNSPLIRKIGAMLAAAGRDWKYADAIAARMFEVERVAFCNIDQQRALVAALAIDQRRHAKPAATTEAAQ